MGYERDTLNLVAALELLSAVLFWSVERDCWDCC